MSLFLYPTYSMVGLALENREIGLVLGPEGTADEGAIASQIKSSEASEAALETIWDDLSASENNGQDDSSVTSQTSSISIQSLWTYQSSRTAVSLLTAEEMAESPCTVGFLPSIETKPACTAKTRGTGGELSLVAVDSQHKIIEELDMKRRTAAVSLWIWLCFDN